MGLAFGTDYPVEPVTPFRGLYAAVTRKSENGKQEYVPDQRITIDQAITAYTQGSAFAEFEEKEKGKLVSGMHGLTFEQPLGRAAGGLAPETGECRAGHLNDASLLGPLDHALQIFTQNRIAFGMRDDNRDSVIAEFVKGIGRILRDAVVAEFHEQVVSVADDVPRRIGVCVLQILVREMKVAP